MDSYERRLVTNSSTGELLSAQIKIDHRPELKEEAYDYRTRFRAYGRILMLLTEEVSFAKALDQAKDLTPYQRALAEAVLKVKEDNGLTPGETIEIVHARIASDNGHVLREERK